MNHSDTTKLTQEQLVFMLASDGLLNSQQKAEIRLKSKRHIGEHPIRQIGELGLMSAAETDKSLTSEYITRWLADKYDMTYLRIDPLKIDVDMVASVMSYNFADRHNILAVDVSNDSITVAISDIDDLEWVRDLEHITKKEVQLVFSEPGSIKRYTNEFYNLSKSVKGASGQDFTGKTDIGNLEQLVELSNQQELDANDQHIIRVVDWVLSYAFEQRASDIHIEPRRNKGYIRFRIDGVLHTVHDLPIDITKAVVSRLKILGRMDLAEKRRPLDGRIKTKNSNGEEIELRLSTLPTAFGEKFVGRIFDPTVLLRDFEELGMDDQEQTLWLSLINQPTGIVLVTGPTGSGKTTTLYTSLKKLATSEVNVCTLEDPIEMVEPSFNQMQINHEINLDFASGIRALLRQDPDIIMVGEIRDAETAEMAVQAALTGHLVISTLHTNDAPLAITRLLEIGIPSYLINATLLGVIAQRLVRLLCPHCKKPVDISDEAWEALTGGDVLAKPEQIYEASGCDNCRNTGYKGRAGIYEMLKVDNQINNLIRDEANAREMRNAAIEGGMNLLRVAGAIKVAQGVTTLDEVFRVAPTSDH